MTTQIILRFPTAEHRDVFVEQVHIMMGEICTMEKDEVATNLIGTSTYEVKMNYVPE